MKTKERWVGLIFLGLVLLVLAVSTWLTWRALRQQRLDRALIAAVKRSDDKAVVSLLNQGADANCRDERRPVIPFWQLLYDRLQGRNPKPSHAPTPLLLALMSKDEYDRNGNWVHPPENFPLIRALVAHGAQVNITDADGDTPLILAARNGFLDSARFLLDCDAHVNATNGGHTALMEAIRWGGEENRDHYDVCVLLLQRGANPNILRDSDHFTPLMSAIYGQHEYAARLLLQWKVDVNVGWKEHAKTAMDCAYYHLPSFVPVLKAAVPDEMRATKRLYPSKEGRI